MRNFLLLLSSVYFLTGIHGLGAQASMGFEDQATTQNCDDVTCQYDDVGDQNTMHILQSFNGIPVSSTTMGTSLGFIASFRPSRSGASNVGLTDEQFFGYAGNETFINNVTQPPIQGSQGYIMEDIDGEATLTFDPVLLNGGAGGSFSMQYILDGSFEADGTGNDKLKISLLVTDCSAMGTIDLLDADGDGGSEIDLDALSDDTWMVLNEDLTPYQGCQVQLVIIADCDSSSEEFGFDDINFTAGTALPVEFMSIAANQYKKAVLLDWSTITETDNRGFSVERSIDGRSFAPIGWVEGSGGSQTQVNYEFEDSQVRMGQTYYYRLRQEDLDGAYAYSSIVDVTLTGGGREEVAGQFFPNPAISGQSNIELYPTEAGDWTFTVIDANGRQLKETKHTLTAGYNLIPVNLVKHPVGAYQIRMASKEQTIYRKVIR